MVRFHTFWVQTDIACFTFAHVLRPHCLHLRYFDAPFTRTWFMVSSFIIFQLFPRCSGTVFMTFPQLFSINSRINISSGTKFPCSLRYNRQEFTAESYSDQVKKGPSFLWSNSYSIICKKVVIQIHSSHLIIVVLEGVWHWYFYMFLFSPWRV